MYIEISCNFFFPPNSLQIREVCYSVFLLLSICIYIGVSQSHWYFNRDWKQIIKLDMIWQSERRKMATNGFLAFRKKITSSSMFPTQYYLFEDTRNIHQWSLQVCNWTYVSPFLSFFYFLLSLFLVDWDFIELKKLKNLQKKSLNYKLQTKTAIKKHRNLFF